jgi:hypothetical protein
VQKLRKYRLGPAGLESVAESRAFLERVTRDVEADDVATVQVEACLWEVNRFLQKYDEDGIDLRRRCWDLRRLLWGKNRPAAEFGPRAKAASAGDAEPGKLPVTASTSTEG